MKNYKIIDNLNDTTMSETLNAMVHKSSQSLYAGIGYFLNSGYKNIQNSLIDIANVGADVKIIAGNLFVMINGIPTINPHLDVVDKKSPGQKKQNTYCEMGDYTIINGDIIVDTEDVEFIKSLNRYVSKSSGGYPLIFVNNGWFFIHRLLMGLPQKYDKETKIIVDHINGNRLDCRKQNMRICHKEKNPINCKTYKSNTSGVKGVSWMKKLSKYQASICVNGKSIYLGVHSDINDAIAARKEAENKYFGEFNRGGVNE